MARLLVHLHSPALTGDEKYDAHVAANHPRAGDIVSIVEDNHVFSRIEMTNGRYRIIDVPGVAMQDLVHLVETHRDERGRQTGKRKLALDHTKMQASMSRAELDAAVKVRP